MPTPIDSVDHDIFIRIALDENNISAFEEGLKLGFDPKSIKAYRDGSVILKAISKKTINKELISYLVANGADINAKGKDGATIFETLVLRNNARLVRAVRKNDQEEVNKILKQFYDNLKILVDLGYDLNAQDENGNTPLMRISYISTIYFFLEAFKLGANLELKNNEGKNLSDMISFEKMDDFVSNLKQIKRGTFRQKGLLQLFKGKFRNSQPLASLPLEILKNIASHTNYADWSSEKMMEQRRKRTLTTAYWTMRQHGLPIEMIQQVVDKTQASDWKETQAPKI